MKEKTFEELIQEGLSKIDDFDDVPVLMVKLLKRVREATIEECIDKISELHGSIYKGAYEEYLATNLPKDRIKTESVQ